VHAPTASNGNATAPGHDALQGSDHHADPARTVLNQPPPLLPANLFDLDLPLQEALIREGGDWGVERVRAAGAYAGSLEAAEHSRRAEANAPQLRAYDRYGNRIDQIELDPSWHALLGDAIERELHSLPWSSQRPGAHLVRAAAFMQHCQINGGVMCPVSMTAAAVPALREGAPELAGAWEGRLTASDYSAVALAGMAMTERQGGSDVRANITLARAVGSGDYELIGHKWFCSYPLCDFFLMLAQAPEGLSCFLVERGEGMELMRLKDKLGTRSLPSAEIELRGARGRLIGVAGEGVKAIITMVNHTRLDCALSSAAVMRRGLVEAVHHARHRAAFGAPLIDAPAMANVLGDLALESEAATLCALRLAASYDRDEAPLRRLATAVVKYWLCKRAPAHVGEALECLGGNGFVEESGMPLFYRDAPVSSIWEGSGNVCALDALRAIDRQPQSLEAFLAECELAKGASRTLDHSLLQLRADCEELLGALRSQRAGALAAQFSARALVERLALTLQASLLARHSPDFIAEPFIATRLGKQGGHSYGTLPGSAPVESIIDRALPAE